MEEKKKKGDEATPEEETQAHGGREREQPDRAERIPFGTPTARLPFREEDGFQYRVFNDGWMREPGRIQRAIRAGYEKVEDFDPVTVGTNDDGSAIKGVLMRIPKDLYEEDQKVKQKEVDKVDKAIKAGKLEEKPDDNRYIPQGIKIWSSNRESTQ